nr:ABC transporter A family member 9-like [Tanacetum cinerariifolium]
MKPGPPFLATGYDYAITLVSQLSNEGCTYRSIANSTIDSINTKFEEYVTIRHMNQIEIKSFPRGTSCGRDGLRAQHLMDCLSRAVVAVSNELIFSITQVRLLVSKVSAIMIGHSLDDYLYGLQFGVQVAAESEAILHFVNRLIEVYGGDVGLSMLLVDFKNAFNLVDRELDCITKSTPYDHAKECNKVIPWPFAFFTSATSPNMLYFTMRTCPPRFFEFAQRSLDVALRSSLELIVTAAGPGFESIFYLSPRQMALWTSQREEHTSDWLRTIPILGLGQTMNGKTYRCVLCYRLGIPLFFGSKPCSACSKVFSGDIYGDHDVSCAGIIGIKHRHNVVRDTLVGICYRSGISAGKKVDIGLDGWRDKPLRPTDILIYS